MLPNYFFLSFRLRKSTSSIGCQTISRSNSSWFWPSKPFVAWSGFIWWIASPWFHLLIPSDLAREASCSPHLSGNGSTWQDQGGAFSTVAPILWKILSPEERLIPSFPNFHLTWRSQGVSGNWYQVQNKKTKQVHIWRFKVTDLLLKYMHKNLLNSWSIPG